MDKKEMAERLEVLIEQLQSLKSEMLEDAPVLPPEAEKLLGKRICLVCKKPITQDNASRGADPNCYRQVKRRVDSGELTDAEAVRLGLWAPKHAGGRRRKALVDAERLKKLRQERGQDD